MPQVGDERTVSNFLHGMLFRNLVLPLNGIGPVHEEEDYGQ
jgi:hypothetical protein